MKNISFIITLFLSSHFQALRKYQRVPIPLNAREWKTDYPATTHKNYPRPKGYIWVATSSGLNRFDGQKFILYGQDNHKTEQNWINSLLADPTE